MSVPRASVAVWTFFDNLERGDVAVRELSIRREPEAGTHAPSFGVSFRSSTLAVLRHLRPDMLDY
jgi:hypothetical protein